MSTFDHQDSEWVDDQLCRVPIPKGLLARLRAIAISDDAALDAALCDVAIPLGLIERLSGIASYDDAAIDRALRDVAVPHAFIGGLSTISEYEDRDVDAGLLDVPIPAGLCDRLHAIVDQPSHKVVLPQRGTRRRANAWQLVAAAMLLFMISSAYLIGIAGLVSTAYQPSSEPEWIVMTRPQPLELEVRQELPPLTLAIDERDPPAANKDLPIQRAEISLAELESIVPDVATPLAELDHDRFFHSAADRMAMLENVVLLQIPPFAKNVADVAAPLESVAEIKPRGRVPQWSDIDLLRQLMVGRTNPFVMPSAGIHFQRCDVPLTISLRSFEQAIELLQRPDISAALAEEALAELVRSEEFVQAIEYDIEPPRLGAVAMQVLGGPSLFGGDARMLHVIARASDAAESNRPSAAHVAVLVDVSSTMAKHGNLKRARAALLEMTDWLSPRDRVSLISHGETAGVLVDYAGAGQLASYADVVRQLSTQPGNNVGEGLRLSAAILNRREQPDTARHLVILSDGVGLLADRTLRQIENVLATLARQSVRVSVIDVGRDGLKDPLLRRVAEAGRGTYSETSEVTGIGQALRAAVLGRPRTVASRMQVSVNFNPEAVAAYRLIGHEPTAAVGALAAPVEFDLEAGQSLSSLIEVHLKPEGAFSVGRVEMSWRDPNSGVSRTLRQPISRVQFAPTFAEAATPLQAAIVAAETAELLRKSPYVDRPASSLAEVRRLADRVDQPLANSPSFRRMVQLLDRALQLGLR